MKLSKLYGLLSINILGVRSECPFSKQLLRRGADDWNPFYENTMSQEQWASFKKEIIKLTSLGFGPRLVRLAWHECGQYDRTDGSGSPHASIRRPPVSEFPSNGGLSEARVLFIPLKSEYPSLTFADMYSFAGAVSIAAAGGPTITWRPGRNDAPLGNQSSIPTDRLPSPHFNLSQLLDTFHRMGLSAKELVALSGGHSLGEAKPDISGFDGYWTSKPHAMTNEYFQRILSYREEYHPVEVRNLYFNNGETSTTQYVNNDKLILMPSDVALLDNEETRSWVTAYAGDEKLFFNDFKNAFQKLLELGVSHGLGNPIDTTVPVEDLTSDRPSGRSSIDNSSASLFNFSVYLFSFCFALIRLL